MENASYNSLQATLTKRLAHRFSLQASYVWSKAIALGQAAPNAYNLSTARGLLPGDVRNNFIASYIWISPDIHHLGLIGKELLSGWQLNGITSLRTGLPFNITSGKDTNLDGVATNDQPNQVSNPNISGGRSRTAKIAGISIPPPSSSFPQAPLMAISSMTVRRGRRISIRTSPPSRTFRWRSWARCSSEPNCSICSTMSI